MAFIGRRKGNSRDWYVPSNYQRRWRKAGNRWLRPADKSEDAAYARYGVVGPVLLETLRAISPASAPAPAPEPQTEESQVTAQAEPQVTASVEPQTTARKRKRGGDR